MGIKIPATVFFSVFVAELDDKTQLATTLFAADKDVCKWTVLAGSAISGFMSARQLQLIAGAAFIAIAIWALARA